MWPSVEKVWTPLHYTFHCDIVVRPCQGSRCFFILLYFSHFIGIKDIVFTCFTYNCCLFHQPSTCDLHHSITRQTLTMLLLKPRQCLFFAYIPQNNGRTLSSLFPYLIYIVTDTVEMKLSRCYVSFIRYIHFDCLMEWGHIKSLIKSADWVGHLNCFTSRAVVLHGCSDTHVMVALQLHFTC